MRADLDAGGRECRIGDEFLHAKVAQALCAARRDGPDDLQGKRHGIERATLQAPIRPYARPGGCARARRDVAHRAFLLTRSTISYRRPSPGYWTYTSFSSCHRRYLKFLCATAQMAR